MKTLNRIVLVLSGLFSCAGCASLQSVSMTSIPRGADRTHPIEATENNVALLGIHFSNSFADGVPEDLRKQCSNGKVTGIYAKYESKWYVLVENRSVTAKAYCVPAEVAQMPANEVPTPATTPAPAPSVLPRPPAPSGLPVAPAPAVSFSAKRSGGSS